MYLSTPLRILQILLLLALPACSSVQDALNPDFIVTPRLQNNEPERRAELINSAAFNAKAQERTMGLYQGYIGDLRTSYEGDQRAIARDLNDLARSSPSQFNPNELVSINFSNAKLNYILEQLLRGALGVNYMAPDNLPTVPSFRVDTAVPKSRVLQMVRDLLARHNLVMRQLNGVYHIGTADVINTIEANAAKGGDTEGTKVVKLPRGNAQQVATLANQLLTSGVQIIPSGAADSLIIKANASDFAPTERMLQMLSATAVGFDQVAILPLTRSAPEAVAQQITALYAPTLRQEHERVTVVPLQNQQAILVGTSHPSLMKNLVQLVAQLDRSTTDQSDLRVIPLTHLHPSQIVPQLAQIFGADLPVSTPTGNAAKAKIAGVSTRLRDPTPLAPLTEAVTGAAAEKTSKSDDGEEASTRTSSTGDVRIVSDDRTNSILVHSTYTVFKRMKEVVALLDVPQAQVIIEATVVEVELNDTIQSGVEFLLKYSGISFGNGSNPTTDNSLLGATTDIGHVNVQAALKTLRTLANTRIVSSPYLTVLDGEPARLVIGDQVPFAVTNQSTIVDGKTTTTSQTQILDTGIVLQITPRIHANNSVSLEILQSVSKVSDSGIKGDYRPTISTRDITSRILAQSGRTVLLGGLIQERKDLSERGVPVASEIPIIGQLFRSNSDTRSRTELLVLITPRVSRTSAEIEEITRVLQGLQQFQAYPDLKR